MNPDEAVDMAKKKRMLHWDSRKKKFVKTSLAELGESKGSKKIRTESGELVSRPRRQMPSFNHPRRFSCLARAEE